jgi:hypothetical protein
MSETELQAIVTAHDLDRNGVFDEVLEIPNDCIRGLLAA